MKRSIYLIGSLRNKNVPDISHKLRETGNEVFSSWYCAGEFADDAWKAHEQGRGLTFPEALKDYAAQHVYEFDKKHLDRCDTVVLLLPAGKSGHLELGYSIGKGKPGYILLEEGPDPRWDVMYNFASGVYYKVEELISELASNISPDGDSRVRTDGTSVPCCIERLA